MENYTSQEIETMKRRLVELEEQSKQTAQILELLTQTMRESFGNTAETVNSSIVGMNNSLAEAQTGTENFSSNIESAVDGISALIGRFNSADSFVRNNSDALLELARSLGISSDSAAIAASSMSGLGEDIPIVDSAESIKSAAGQVSDSAAILGGSLQGIGTAAKESGEKLALLPGLIGGAGAAIGAMATPAGLAAIGVGAFAASVSHLLDEQRRSQGIEVTTEDDVLGKYNSAAQSIDNLSAAMGRNQQAGEAQMQTVATQNAVIETMVEQTMDLAAKTDLTAGEKAKLASRIAELNQLMPGMNLYYDEENRNLGENTEAIAAYVGKARTMEEISAIRERQIELMTEDEVLRNRQNDLNKLKDSAAQDNLETMNKAIHSGHSLREMQAELNAEQETNIRQQTELGEKENNRYENLQMLNEALSETSAATENISLSNELMAESQQNAAEIQTESIGNMLEAYSEIVAVLAESDISLTDVLSGAAEAPEEIQGKIDALAAVLTSSVPKISAAAGEAGEAAKVLPETAASAIADGTPEVETSAQNAALAVFDGFVTTLGSLGVTLSAESQTLMEQLRTGIVNGTVGVEDACRQAIVLAIGSIQAATAENSGAMQSSGKMPMEQYKSGISSATPGVVSQGQSSIRQTNSAMKTAASGGNFISIGISIVTGIISGLKSAVGSLISAAGSVASSALGAMKSVLNINSPSKEAIKLGESVTEGFALGMEQTQDDVKKAASDTARAALDTMSSMDSSEIFTETKDAASALSKETQAALSKSAAAAEESTAKTANAFGGMVKNYNSQVGQMSEETKKRVEEISKSVSKDYETLEKALVDALKASYKEQEELQTQMLDNEIANVRRATDAKISEYDREFLEKLKLIDEESYEQIKAIEQEIQALEDKEKAEQKAQKKADQDKKFADLYTQLAQETDPEKAAEIQNKINDLKLQQEREALKESRDSQKAALKNELAGAQTAAKQKVELLEEEKKAAQEIRDEELKYFEGVKQRELEIAQAQSEELRKLLEDELESYKASYAAKAALRGDSNSYDTYMTDLQTRYDNAVDPNEKAKLKKELDELTAFSETFFQHKTLIQEKEHDIILSEQQEISFEIEKKALSAHFKELAEATKLQNEAQLLLIEQNCDAMQALLDKYNPLWYEQGRSRGEQFAQGLEDSEKRIQTIIDRINKGVEEMEYAGVIVTDNSFFSRSDAISPETLALILEGKETEASLSLSSLEAKLRDVVDRTLASVGHNQQVLAFENINRPVWQAEAIASSASTRSETRFGSNVDQTINIYQPVQSPVEMARAVKNMAKDMGYYY